MNVWLPFDVFALLVLWWSAAAFAHGGHEVDNWRNVLLAGCLIAIHAFAIVGVLSLLANPQPVPWRFRGLIWPCAGVAAWLYDYRFGIARHLRMTRDAVLDRLHRHKATGAR